MTIDYGPQYPPDLPFTARVRFHQSWYRATVLGVGYGTGPEAHHRSRFGNMLDLEAAEAGLNFLTPASFDVARRRIAQGGGVAPFRCLHNMLSSQPDVLQPVRPARPRPRAGERGSCALPSPVR